MYIVELPRGPIKRPVSAEHYGDKNMGKTYESQFG